MAKRQEHSLPPIITNKGGHETIDFGIYSHRAWWLGASFPGEATVGVDEAVELFKAARKASKFSALPAIEQLRQLAASGKHLPGGNEESQTALRILQLVRSFLAAGPSERDAQVFMKGIAVGRLIEKIFVLPHQSDALRGKRQAIRNRENNEKRASAANRENEKRRRAVDTEMARQARSREKLSFRRAMKAAATQCRCSFDAIKKAKPINHWTARKKQK